MNFKKTSSSNLFWTSIYVGRTCLLVTLPLQAQIFKMDFQISNSMKYRVCKHREWETNSMFNIVFVISSQIVWSINGHVGDRRIVWNIWIRFFYNKVERAKYIASVHYKGLRLIRYVIFSISKKKKKKRYVIFSTKKKLFLIVFYSFATIFLKMKIWI